MCIWVTWDLVNLYILVSMGPGFWVCNKFLGNAVCHLPPPICIRLNWQGLREFWRANWTARWWRHWILRCGILFQLVNSGELQKVLGSGKPQDWMDNLIESEGWSCQSGRVQLGGVIPFELQERRAWGRVWEERAKRGLDWGLEKKDCESSKR